ncbi:MAG: hypothetical protein M0Z48_04010 [Nitrospiraceae bacterium]|nr:hypothetical protein [Nitrospiraceae bacterium]
MKETVVALALMAMVIAGIDGKGWAFHDGGVGACDGCHTMHNSIGGQPVQLKNGAVPSATVGQASNAYLMKGTDPSSTCLNCHQETGNAAATGQFISTSPADMPAGYPPIELTPGGDFGWLQKTYTWVYSGTQYTDPGQNHGHNIVAADFNYVKDSTIITAPGGTYPASALSCISCHDPHGKYRRNSGGSITKGGSPIIGSGSYNTSPTPAAGQAVGVYRLLGGVGYQPGYLLGSYAFSYAPPPAVAPSVYNQSESTYPVRVAYGSDGSSNGMSFWCRNCHPNIHTSSGPSAPLNVYNQTYSFPQTHPIESYLSMGTNNNYNAYIESGVYTGTQSTSYWSIVPYEENNLNYSTLASHANNNGSYLTGPSSSDYVSCMTCHRAHATGWDYMLRFNYLGIPDGNHGWTQIIDDNSGGAVWPDPVLDPYKAMGRTTTETQQAYYGRPATTYAAVQYVLCNKCHYAGMMGGGSGR